MNVDLIRWRSPPNLIECLGQPVPAAKLAQIFQTAKLIENLAVMHVGEFVIHARRENVIPRRRTDRGSKRRDRGIQRGPRSILSSLTGKTRWRRQREQRVLLHWNQSIYHRRVKQRIVLVSGEEKSTVASVIKLRNHDRPTQSETRIVFLKRHPRQSQRVVLPCICIQRFVAKEIESAPAKLARSTLRAQVQSAAGCASVLGRKLIANELNFFQNLHRRREALAGSAVVIVVEAVNRDVVGISSTSRKRKVACFLGRRVRTGSIFSKVTSR